ncbi:Peptidase S8/S53, subtilisin/kexin/sedolisin [Penicillium italicum]|uniref:tripeptidyl-peptidase II n=1 Tax=Penicillium italicum TaxID=40296 RepID=A0A0A2KS31_PENIT|nr:Peptidase S8/S53, subtilisin/kexin/sedolisin [Penicillium italicum]
MITLNIGLRHGRSGEIERELQEISDPSSRRYRQFLKQDQVHNLVKPTSDDVALVLSWLSTNGIDQDELEFSPGGDWITLNLSISAAENLLDTKYFTYRNGNSVTVRTSQWSIPSELHEIVDTIQPTTSFLHLKTTRNDHDNYTGETNLNQLAVEATGPSVGGMGLDLSNLPGSLTPEQACNVTAVTPLCLRTLYGTLLYKVQKPDSKSMALVNFLGEFNNRSDIAQFAEMYRPDAIDAAQNFHDISINGGINQQLQGNETQLQYRSGLEGNLDAEAMIGVAHPIPLTTYTVGGPPPPFIPSDAFPTNTNEPFLAWLNWLLAQPDSELPSVVSSSYGEPEGTVPPSYARRVCIAFAQLGLRGVSVITGSGDHGVGHPAKCQDEFLVNFPDSCPYVTSVGATKGINPEAVAINRNNGFVSGGGFSRYFPRPSFQNQNSVGRYLDAIGTLHEGRFNPSGRSFPDVATQGYRYVTVWNGTTRLVDGTSASAPTFAAIVALVNDALAAENLPSMGFLNPWLYSEGWKAFTDVTEGSIPGCNTTGFPAMTGWDVASGWGTPWFPKFKELALQRRFATHLPWYMRWTEW